jgi:tRNA threonylcarbamoyladenosine biosynthesis protein TsaE
VLARVHPSLVGGPALVHVDAYRLGSLAELDDLDLDASVDDSVTVVEWGEGKAEVLAEGRSGHYLVSFDRSREDDVREISIARR